VKRRWQRTPSGMCPVVHFNPAVTIGLAISKRFAWAALAQVWLFIVAPIIGAVIAGATYAMITGAPSADEGIAQNP
jgi:aquaporin Z